MTIMLLCRCLGKEEIQRNTISAEEQYIVQYSRNKQLY